MMLIFTLIKKEILESIRSKKLLILGILFIFIAISSPVIAKLIPVLFESMPNTGIKFTIPTPTWHDAIDQFVKNISQIGLIVVIFLFAGTVAEEKNKKTLEMILTKPVSRMYFVLAKYKVAFGLVLIGQIASSVIFYIYTRSIFGSFDLSNFAVLSLVIVVYLWFITALVILVSTVTSSQLAAVGFAFIAEILIATVLGNIEAIKSYMPSYALGHYKDIMAGSFSDIWLSVLVSAILIILMMIGSIALFSKQEVER